MADGPFGKKAPSFFGGGGKRLRPNIVMILLDRFRNDMRGVHGVFDELARPGEGGAP